MRASTARRGSVPRPWRSGSSPAPARTRCPGSRAPGREPVSTDWGEAFVSRGDVGGRRGAAHLAPRRRASAALQPRHASREHRGAEGAGRRRRARGDGLRRRRSGGASWARWCASTTCTSSPTGCRTARCARSSPSRARCERGHWIYEGPFSAALRAALLARRRRRRASGPRRRLLRPRRRAALQHAGGDPRAGGVRRHRRVPDGGPETVLCGEAELPVRAARLPDRLRQRRPRGGDAGRDADRDDGRVDARRSPPCCARRCRCAARAGAARRRLPLRDLALADPDRRLGLAGDAEVVVAEGLRAARGRCAGSRRPSAGSRGRSRRARRASPGRDRRPRSPPPLRRG